MGYVLVVRMNQQPWPNGHYARIMEVKGQAPFLLKTKVMDAILTVVFLVPIILLVLLIKDLSLLRANEVENGDWTRGVKVKP